MSSVSCRRTGLHQLIAARRLHATPHVHRLCVVKTPTHEAGACVEGHIVVVRAPLEQTVQRARAPRATSDLCPDERLQTNLMRAERNAPT